ncbi:tetratricopeptide repeat protein [Halorussus sp. MSC15.2]|uniref:tetratricopeptide repeat protein n=1 Tax=Halorussus sp. MSC15.2 TaxID=2283638 RepID=UPI0013D156BC|nr:tetratricopeptide repeat protein [Halorussus sp. MSC15.2]NEU59237.1 tetratricopeptide repeat protein [Halorussus sp. MSC15.2]
MDKDNWIELMEKDVPKGGEYGFWFQERYPIYEERRRFIRNLVAESEPKREHIILAALMEGDDAYVPHTLTPNFDDLLYDAFYRYFDDRPLLIDHNAIVPQFQLTGNRASIIQLHGDYLYDNLQNLNTEALKANMEDALKRTLREYGLIVVGYSGRDESIMSVINDDDFEISGHGVYWCTLDADDLSPKAAELLNKPNTYVVEIEGAESLFDRFFEQMKDEIDPALPEPSEIRSRAESRARELPGKVSESNEADESGKEETTEEQPKEVEEALTEEVSESVAEEVEEVVAEEDEEIGAKEIKEVLPVESVDEETLSDDEIPAELRSVGLRMKADNLHYEGDYEQAVDLYTQAIELDPADQFSYLNRGSVRIRLGEYDGAATDLKKALEYFEESGDIENEATSRSNLGVVASNRGELDAAKEYYKESLALDREMGNHDGEARVLNNLGQLARKRGELDVAEEYYEKSLDIIHEVGNHDGEARVLNNLGQLAHERGELDAAEEYYEESLALEREVGDRHGKAKVLDNLGQLACERGELDVAEEYYEESLDIMQEVGDRHGEARVLNNFGQLARERGELDTAAEQHEKAFEMSSDIGAMLTAIDAVENCIDVYEEKDATDEAIEWCGQAIDVAEKLDNEEEIERFKSRREELAEPREDG